jgi:anti-sigma B factor antagonist
MDINEAGPVTVVTLGDKEVQDGPHIQAIRQQLYALVDAGHKEIVLDFRRIQYLLASAAIALLINLKKRLREAGGTLALYNVGPDVLEVFRITRLDTIFDIHAGDGPAEGGSG